MRPSIKRVTLIAASIAVAAGSAANAVPPPNDRCDNATVLPPSGQSWINFSIAPLDTTDARTWTCREGETVESCGHPSGNSNSVYFEYEPTCSGTADINTFGSSYDTVLSVWSGCAGGDPFCFNPDELGCNDDASGTLQSRLVFPVEGGTTYIIKVTDYGPSSGGGTLRLNGTVTPPDDRKGKISRNVYRSPYAGNEQFSMIVDYVDHCGSMDSRALTRVCTGNVNQACTSNAGCAQAGGTCEYVLVAPSDGIVCSVIQHFDDCGSTGEFGNFGNSVVILHANGEASRHLHLKQWSPSQFGITAGMFVTAGQPIGIEGDVGRSTGGEETACGTDGPPRIGTCLESVPSDATNCFRHDHWNIIRYTTGEVVQPLTCNNLSGYTTDNLYKSGTNYTAADCGTAGSYPVNTTLSNTVHNGYGTSQVVQAHNTITASTVTVQNRASVVYHAGSRVRLMPGFRARAGGYFRAERATPDQTAASSWPIPSECPCSGAVGFCYQWTDPFSPDGVSHGCSPPGPTFANCHGCSIGGRCCPCVGSGTCQAQGTCP